jgi:hypothetical protein
MTLPEVVVFVLLAAIVIPVALAEIRRLGARPASRASTPHAPKRAAAAKPPLRLVVNKSDMDRELAALLAKNSRKTSEPDE